jgi:hypothetical protein
LTPTPALPRKRERGPDSLLNLTPSS